MPLFIPRAGVALLIESAPRPGEGTKHLHVVLDNLASASNLDHPVLLVSVTSRRGLPSEDLSCVLNTGDHEFIKHESYVLYAKARQLTVAQIQNGIDHHQIAVLGTFDALVFDRIVAGALRSDRMPQELQEILQTH